MELLAARQEKVSKKDDNKVKETYWTPLWSKVKVLLWMVQTNNWRSRFYYEGFQYVMKCSDFIMNNPDIMVEILL